MKIRNKLFIGQDAKMKEQKNPQKNNQQNILKL